jgi:branched-chain amino acid transport system ATP-binding protein
VVLLEVADVHVFYGNIEAVAGVSLHVEASEIVLLLGSNGAGKTTILRTLSGLQRARSGRILFDGQDITRMAAHEIVDRGISHVPEGRRIFATLSVEENLNLGGYLNRNRPKLVSVRRAAVYELFPRLAERRRQLSGTLSGGEQQMLAIGRALMAEPRLLALDEPSLGLSPMLNRVIFNVIRDIAKRGIGILLVEQNARQALRIGQRAYVLESGSVALAGAAHQLAQDPRVQRAYLGGFASLPGRREGVG